MPHPILIAAALPAAALEDARARFEALIDPGIATDTDRMLAVAAAHGARAIIISGGRSKMTAEVFAQMPPSVSIVATSSVGFDHIDLAAAKAAGVMVTNTPDVLTNATADLALYLILGACRRGREYAQIMEQGWRRSFAFDEMLGMEVGARTLGIVGMGRIGQAVARRARAFGMPVIYHNRNRLPAALENGATYFSSLKTMLPNAQVLSLNLPAAGLKPIMDAGTIALLPPGAVLINTGRGALVDEDALIEALQSGHLAAAGLDVFRNEPAYDLRLRDLPNVFMTPHVGSATLETRTAMAMRALDNVYQALDGTRPRDLVEG